MKSVALAVGAFAFSTSGAIFLTQCSSSSSGTASDASVPCPADPPSVGSACSLPSSTQCSSYATAPNACPMIYVCNNGTWSGVGNSGLAPACPETIPVVGSPCVSAVCDDVDFECPFTCANGKTVTALCEQDTWSVDPCVVDAGIDDAAILDARADAEAVDANDDSGDGE